MYKAILVDDEPLALEGLKLAVDWESLGYEICGECSNGEEALQLISKLIPDLVITDIRMPGMDGLELIEQVINHINSNIKFIIVSGYGEFEYAKTALRFGIQHYVLKPVFQEEITGVLIDIRGQIDQDKRMVVKSGSRTNRLAVDDLLDKILHDEFNSEYQALLQKSFTNREIFQPWIYVIVETGFIPKTGIAGLEREEPDGRPEVEVIQCIVAGIFKNYCFLLEQDLDYYGLLVGTDALSPNELDGWAGRICRKLADEGLDGFYLAVGEQVPELYSIGHSFKTARQALDYKFFTPVNRPVFYNEVKNKIINHQSREIAYLDAVVDALEQINPEELENSIDSVFRYFHEVLMSPEIVKLFVMNIIYRSLSLIHEMNGDSAPIIAKYGITRLEQRKMTLADYKEMLQSYTSECCRYLNALRKRNSQANIYRIEEYVKQNFKHDLTIKEIANNFYMHPAYIGQLFLKRFGISFHEYLHRLRIREAENLMAATSMKSHEIAMAVGYNNYHSFLDNFRKYTGYTPADYKNR